MIANERINIEKFIERKFNLGAIQEVEALTQMLGLDSENKLARMDVEAEPDINYFTLLQSMLVAGGGITITPGDNQLTISANRIYDGGNAESTYFEEYAIDGGGAQWT